MKIFSLNLQIIRKVFVYDKKNIVKQQVLCVFVTSYLSSVHAIASCVDS